MIDMPGPAFFLEARAAPIIDYISAARGRSKVGHHPRIQLLRGAPTGNRFVSVGHNRSADPGPSVLHLGASTFSPDVHTPVCPPRRGRNTLLLPRSALHLGHLRL